MWQIDPKYTDFLNTGNRFSNLLTNPIISLYLRIFGKVRIGKNSKFFGRPIMLCRGGGKIVIGDDFTAISNSYSNPVGISHRVIISVRGKNANVTIGNNVGISGVSINCWSGISIGDNVIIGGGAAIWDTDFHPSNYLLRRSSPNEGRSAPIIIEDEVFIGARAVILKGVKIGARSVIAANSVLHDSVPADSLVFGNPMVIKSLKEK